MESDKVAKREETNDIIHFLLPKLEESGIELSNCKVDVTTEKSGNKRGDIWISLKRQISKDFEKNIIGLIEAKHRKCNIGDMDWRDAMKQGKEKSIKQNLNYYIVTNCNSDVRFYNSYNDEEITLDGFTLTRFVNLDILNKIQSQVSPSNSDVLHKTNKSVISFSEAEFRNSLKILENIYRGAGIRKGDDRIDPTVSFVVLKYISEKESEERTLDTSIQLWDDYREIAQGLVNRDLGAEFKTTIDQIWGDESEYCDNEYIDFRDLIKLPKNLKDEHYRKIYRELDKYSFHGGASFDLFGTIYEEFATQSKKKEFGEFYTRRHITNRIAKFLLRKEQNPRELKICDPACGTGGFLTEAFKALKANYEYNNKMSSDVINKLQNNIFWGYDNEPKSVARTKLNMFLVGDGHTHIYENDSLVDWSSKIGWEDNVFNYILANPPMGTYKGQAEVNKFDFTNEKRYELLFLEKIIKATRPLGEIAVVVNDGTLETPSRGKYRQNLLKHCNIYAIISLTKFAFAPYTKEKTYVLFMQKKHENDIGTIQDIPIWHYIVDYDGFANSDKRYKTIYHDDLPELEQMFGEAVDLAKYYKKDKEYFYEKKSRFERKVNEREKEEGLWGYKCKYVEMDSINDSNYYNLISEYYLRPYERKSITIEEFDEQLNDILVRTKQLINSLGKGEDDVCKD